MKILLAYIAYRLFTTQPDFMVVSFKTFKRSYKHDIKRGGSIL